MTCELATTRQDRLNSLWQEFIANDKSIYECVDINLEDEYFTEDFRFSTEEIYDEVNDKYVQFLKTHSTPPAAPPVAPGAPAMPAPAVLPATNNMSFMIKSLQPLSIPEFSGTSSEWAHFRDMFKALIHEQNYPKVLKLAHLKSYLKGEALEVISRLNVSEENYETAWESLSLFYENERRLVHNHLTALFSVKPMTTNSHSEVRRILNETLSSLDALTSMNRSTHYWSDIIVHMLVNNMDKSTRLDWEKSLGRTSVVPNLDRVKSFLQGQALIYESVERTNKSSTASHTESKKAKGNASLQVSMNASSTKEGGAKGKPSYKCYFCKEEHSIYKCPKFQQKSVSDRRIFVIQNKRCVNCLGAHPSKECKSKFKCKECSARHSSLLHDPNWKPDASTLKPADAEKQSNNHESDMTVPQNQMLRPTAPPFPSSNSRGFSGITQSVRGRTGVLLGTARVMVEGPDGRQVSARALIDNCSQPSFISEDLFHELGLTGTPTESSVSAVGGVRTVSPRELTKFKIHPHFRSKFSCEVEALVVPKVCSYSPPLSQLTTNLLYLSHLQLADPAFLDKAEVQVLLGADIHAQIVQGQIVRGRPDEPVATQSLLGWIISGSIPLSSYHTSIVSLHCAANDNLSDLIQNFWKQEELPSAKYLTAEEEQSENHFVKNFRRDGQGRYIVRLPFKDSSAMLRGDSYRKAEAMLRRMELRFARDPEFKKLYFEFMSGYLSEGHMIPVPRDSSLSKSREETFFLPHHGVLKPNSTTTKLRTVFNGSSRTSLNISLNSVLLAGPNLLPELPDLISAWRLYKYVFVADIKQMFRQIKLHPDDFHHQAILWRFDPNDPIQVYYLTTVTYGLICSPFLATRTLRQLAYDYQVQFPLAFDIISKECYMDDLLSGGHSLELTLEKQSQLIKSLKEGGFELRKWLSNKPEVLSQLPVEYLASDPASIFETSAPFAVLGLNWHAGEDVFSFKVQCTQIEGDISKRKVLSRIAQIFDPMGWLAPVVVSAKIFMQSLWLLKCNWDDPLPPDYVEQWEEWVSRLSSINGIAIPRFVNYAPSSTCCEIHGFADASQRACAAVLYLRVIDKGVSSCILLAAKTKVAPIKTLSIPRLELLGADVLAKLAHHYCSILPMKIESVHLWSDSKDVLFWLRKHPSSWQTFVANKCSSIQTLLPFAHWHHVKSSENPADVASRGIDPELLASHTLWWQGPGWLRDSSEPWTAAVEDLCDYDPIEGKTAKIGLLSNVV